MRYYLTLNRLFLVYQHIDTDLCSHEIIYTCRITVKSVGTKLFCFNEENKEVVLRIISKKLQIMFVKGWGQSPPPPRHCCVGVKILSTEKVCKANSCPTSRTGSRAPETTSSTQFD